MDDSSLTHILEDQREEFKTIREEFYRIARFKLVFAIVALAIFSIFITIGPGEIDGSAGKLAERLSNFYISLYILYLIVLASTTVIYYHKVLVSRSNFLNNAITCTNRIQETSNAIRNIHSQKYRSFETGMARMEDNSKTISDVREDLIKLYDEARVGVAAFGVTLLLLLFVALPNPSLILLGLLLTLGSFIMLLLLNSSRHDGIGTFLFPISYSVFIGGLFFFIAFFIPDGYQIVQDFVPIVIIIVISILIISIPVYNIHRIINGVLRIFRRIIDAPLQLIKRITDYIQYLRRQ